MPELAVNLVDEKDLPCLWPLVRAGGYDLGLAGWLLDGRSLLARGGSILAVQASSATLYGVATCEAIEQGKARVLKVRTFVTFELSRDAPVRRALTDAVEKLGRDLGCDAIGVPRPTTPLLKELRKRMSCATTSEARLTEHVRCLE